MFAFVAAIDIKAQQVSNTQYEVILAMNDLFDLKKKIKLMKIFGR